MGKFKSMPIAFRVLFVLVSVWILMSVFVIPMRFGQGVPLLGVVLPGLVSAFLVLVLDVILPGLFLFGLWNRRKWALNLGVGYMGFFLLNSLVAILVLSDVFSLQEMLFLLP